MIGHGDPFVVVSDYVRSLVERKIPGSSQPAPASWFVRTATCIAFGGELAQGLFLNWVGGRERGWTMCVLLVIEFETKIGDGDGVLS